MNQSRFNMPNLENIPMFPRGKRSFVNTDRHIRAGQQKMAHDSVPGNRVVSSADEYLRSLDPLSREYMLQTAGHNKKKILLQSKEDRDNLHAGKPDPDIENSLRRFQQEKQSLGIQTAFTWGKKLIKNAWHYQFEHGSGDPIIPEIFQAGFEAFKISMQKCKVQGKNMDMVMTEYLEFMFEKGLLYQFPDNAAELLENIILAHPYRFEFFDAYYFFMKEGGQLDRVLKFLEKNPNLLNTIADEYSEALEELMGEHLVENGTPFRLEKLKLTYLGNPNDSNAYSYIVSYLIRYKGDYDEARKIAKTIRNTYIRKSLEEDFNSLIPNISGNKSLASDKEALDKSQNALNEIAEREMSKVDKELGPKTGPMAKKDIEIQRTEIQVLTLMNLLTTDTSIEEKIEALKKMQELNINIQHFSMAINMFSAGPIDMEKDPNLVIQNILAIFESGLALPEEIFSIYSARLAEAYYQIGEYRKSCKIAKAAPIVNKQRGSLYYLAKSCFAIAEEGGAEAEGFRQAGLKAATEALPSLKGTPWEADLWRNHLLKPYIENPTAFGSNTQMAYKVAEAIAFKDTSEPLDLEDALILLKISQIQRKYNERVLTVLSIAQSQTALAGLDEGNPLSQELRAISMDLINHFKSQGQYKEMLVAIGLIPNYYENPALIREQVLALIHPSNLTQENYETALEALDPFEDLKAEFEPRLESTRKTLGIERVDQLSPTEYLSTLIDKEINEGLICNDDNIRIAFILDKLKEIIEGYADFLKEKVGSENCFPETGFLENLDLANNETAKRLGIKGLRFQKIDGNIEIVVILENPEKENQSILETITFTLDNNFRLKTPDSSSLQTNPENLISQKVILSTLESLILEELYNTLEGEKWTETNMTISKVTSVIAAYRAQVKKLMSKTPSLKEYAGMEGLQERNCDIIAQIDKIVEEESLDLVPDEECISLITRYIDLIRNCRDLDDPIRTYKSPIDTHSPLSKAIKYLEIFNSEFAHLYLTEEQDLETEDLEQFGIPKTERSCFTGYYELTCVFPEEGEKIISVFLDEDGIAHIPGIDKDHPYYKQLWMLTLESLATKVVPELGPYTHFFRERKARKGGKQVCLPTDYGTSEMTIKKRLCCSQIVRAHSEGKERTTPEEEKLRVLDEITTIFNTIELANRNIEDWRLIIKKDGEYTRIRELFFFNQKEETNFVNITSLCELFNIPVERFEGKSSMPVADLPKDIQTLLQKEIRIQTLGGRRMNLGITWRHMPENLKRDEQGEYELKEATYKRGEVVTIATPDGDKIYRKVRIKPNVKVKIGNQTFLATPDKMSEQSMRRYQEAEDIGIPLSFEPEESIYAVIYDPVADKIVSYKYIGSGRKDEESLLVDRNARKAMKKHERGLPVYLDSAKVREILGEREDLVEAVFPITTNKGFMYGKSYPVWKYLESTTKREDAAGRMLLDLMKKKLSSKEYQEFLEELERQEQERKIAEKTAAATPAATTSAATKPTPKKRGRPSKSQWDRPVEPPKEEELHVYQRERRAQRQKHEATLGLNPNKPYTIKKGRRSEYSDNLWNEDLWYIPPEHPTHKTFLDSLDPKEDEVIVARRTKMGSPLKIKKNALEPKL